MTNYERIRKIPIGEMARRINRLQDMECTPYCKSDCKRNELSDEK